MRTSNLTGAEILKAEKAVDDRRNSRNRGYAKMRDRDQGQVVLSNGVKMLWPVPRPDYPDDGTWVYPRYVPEGIVILDGKRYDAEELRKWLRWA